jgi:CHAD domain-containing protein
VEAVHEARKRCKRLRALIRLLRSPSPKFSRRENRAFRDFARSLSFMRDVDATAEAFLDLVKTEKGGVRNFSSLRAILNARGKRTNATEQRAILAVMAKSVRAAHHRFTSLKLPEDKGFKLIETGLEHSYGRGREAMTDAYERQEEVAFHEWRKRVKDLYYQMQIFRQSWPPVLNHLCKQYERLGDVLGQEHDLMVIRETLLSPHPGQVPPELLQSFLDLLQRRAFELQAEAQAIGRRIYAEKPRAFIRRIKVYWETWQAEISASNEATKPALLPQVRGHY